MPAIEVMRYGPSQLGPSLPMLGSLRCLEPFLVLSHQALLALTLRWRHNLALFVLVVCQLNHCTFSSLFNKVKAPFQQLIVTARIERADP